ncbi:hypothetical protein [Kushneria aurantia]|uniref:Tripartite tricarboxylate transporter TctB family protein n=1 Tax=Kushneria aurantia TaxID=504092 RepID=A0ABV6FZD2_9GAMM|nr:hypothetical protein [Kushneria aurantia]
MEKKGIGDFFFTIVLWLVIGAIAQWLMQSNTGAGAAMGAEGGGISSYWSALGLVALFFAVIAFMLRDLMHNNPFTRSLRVIGTRLLSTTFDIGLFALGGVLYAVLWPSSSGQIPQWQALFIGIGMTLFIVILVVLGLVWMLLKFSSLSLVNIPALEFRPLARTGIYLGLLVLLALAAWLTL